MDLSCIILTWNSAAYVEACMKSVLADLAASGLSHEIFVIDNGSTDGTLDILRRLAPPSMTVIPLGCNTGTTFSRNIGLKMARGRHLAILDSDIEAVQPATFGRLVGFLQDHPEVAIVAPQLQFPSGRYQKTTDVFPTLVHKLRRFVKLRAMEAQEGTAAMPTAPVEVDYAVSAFWVMPATLPRRIGLLDERIFYAPEDVDFCLRAALSGLRVSYLPTVVATHHAQEISRRSPWSRSFREHVKGLAYFYRKHGFLFSLEDVYRRIRQARKEASGADLARP